MKHRWIDLFEDVVLTRSIIWNIRRQTGGTDRTFAIAGGTPPSPPLADYLDIPSGEDLDKPELSPDLLEYAFIDINGAGVKSDVCIAAADDSSAFIVAAQNPSGAAANPSGGTDILGWSPDSSTLYYRGINNNTNRDSEIWEVARDGSGDNLIWSDSAIDGVEWGVLPRVSPDGTMFAWWNDFDANPDDGMHVMDIDGTGLSRIHTAAGEGEFYGWSRDSEWLLFSDHLFANYSRLFKIRPDGSDKTTIYDTTYNGSDFPKLGIGQHSIWVPDSTGIVCAQDDGTDDEIGILDADGSETFTPFSPQRVLDPGSVVGFVSTFGPIFSEPEGRAYWLEGDGTLDTSKVVSTLIDGSDYRVDDDMTDSSSSPQHDDYIFLGFHKRTS